MKVAPGKAAGAVGFANDGYWGMDVAKKRYEGSFWVQGAYEGVFTASLQSNVTGDIFGAVEVRSEAVAGRWVEHRFELMPHTDAPSSNNTFAITFDPKVRRWSRVRHIDGSADCHRALGRTHSTSTSSVCSRPRTKTARTGCALVCGTGERDFEHD
jgi:hypothetical protein